MQDIIFNIGSTKVPPHSVMLDNLEKTKQQLTYVYICVYTYMSHFVVFLLEEASAIAVSIRQFRFFEY